MVRITGTAFGWIGSKMALIKIKRCCKASRMHPWCRAPSLAPGSRSDDLLLSIPLAAAAHRAWANWAMPLQFNPAVERIEIWSATSDGFVISFESFSGPGIHGKPGFRTAGNEQSSTPILGIFAKFAGTLLGAIWAIDFGPGTLKCAFEFVYGRRAWRDKVTPTKREMPCPTTI